MPFFDKIARFAINKFLGPSSCAKHEYSVGHIKIEFCLGPFLYKVGKDDIKIKGISPMRCNLHNVRIREDALDGLDLPIDVRFGVVGHIFLELRLKSAVVRVDDVFAVVQYVFIQWFCDLNSNRAGVRCDESLT